MLLSEKWGHFSDNDMLLYKQLESETRFNRIGFRSSNGWSSRRAWRIKRPALPVPLVTGYSQYGPELAGEALELSGKPYRRAMLVNAVRAALDGRARGPGGVAAG